MKRIIYPLLFVCVLLMTSCQDVIEVNLNNDDLNLYAVDAKITTADEPYVFLYRGLAVTKDSAYAGVSEAKITLTDNATPANTIELVEDATRPGYYTVAAGKTFKGIAEREYTLRIEHEDVVLSSTEFLASVTTIDSIEVYPSGRGEQRFLGVFTYGNEPAGVGDYYKWEIYVNGNYISDADYLAFASDEFVDGNYINGLEVLTDYNDSNKPETRKLKYNDTIQVKQLSISAFAYKYYNQVVNQNSTGSLFSVPPANIKSNITASDGKPVLGLFQAHDVSASNLVIIDDAIESQLKK